MLVECIFDGLDKSDVLPRVFCFYSDAGGGNDRSKFRLIWKFFLAKV